MRMEKPRVEFVPVDLSIVTITSPECDQVNSKKGSIETCTGPDAPYNKCCDGSSSFFD